jgi:hypothetical protein
MSEPKTIKINEVEYIRKDEADLTPARRVDGKPFVIVRSYGAGVFAGYLQSRCDKDQRVTLDRCIRLWRWTGATLSQVARDGIAGAGENKFSVETDGHDILQAIEVIPCTEKARLAIQGVKKWEV